MWVHSNDANRWHVVRFYTYTIQMHLLYNDLKLGNTLWQAILAAMWCGKLHRLHLLSICVVLLRPLSNDTVSRVIIFPFSIGLTYIQDQTDRELWMEHSMKAAERWFRSHSLRLMRLFYLTLTWLSSLWERISYNDWVVRFGIIEHLLLWKPTQLCLR